MDGTDESLRNCDEEHYNSAGGSGDRMGPQDLFWGYKINILGKKDDTPIHFCEKCNLPIKIYGRMIPCKHAFCCRCALFYRKEGERVCPNCSNPVRRIDVHSLGSLFMCNTVPECKRTYLSQRDLEAHINFRHTRT